MRVYEPVRFLFYILTQSVLGKKQSTEEVCVAASSESCLLKQTDFFPLSFYRSSEFQVYLYLNVNEETQLQAKYV